MHHARCFTSSVPIRQHVTGGTLSVSRSLACARRHLVVCTRSHLAPAPRPRRPVRAHLALPDSPPQIHKLTMGDEQIAEFKSMQVVQAKHIKTTTLTTKDDKLEHNERSLLGMNQTSNEKPKWWECGGHVRGKKQPREDDAAGERGHATSGATGQDVTEEEKTKFTWDLAGHRPGLMSEFGGIAGSWLAQPQQGAAVRTKEASRAADVEARGLASQTEAEAPKQAKASASDGKASLRSPDPNSSPSPNPNSNPNPNPNPNLNPNPNFIYP